MPTHPSREQRAQWAVDLHDLAPLMGDVTPAAAHPVGPPAMTSSASAKERLATLSVIWVDATSTQAALDPTLVSDPSRTATLVFCSARHPGGGWERGALAQEEDVSLCSSWTLAARQAAPGFYDQQHRWEGPHAGLWATGHWFASAPSAWLDDPIATAFVGVSAPNLTWAHEQSLPLNGETMGRAKTLLVERLSWALSITARAGCTTLVGGMIGSGVFGWPVDEVLHAWHDALQRAPQRPGRLVMAVPGWGRWPARQKALARTVR